MAISANEHWICFLQNNNIERGIYAKAPSEANIDLNKLWKLNTTIYRLKQCTCNIVPEWKKWPLKLQAKTCRLDASVFVAYHRGKLNEFSCTHGDNVLLGGT